jgi:AmiR/NasT family two-component response regulator
LLQSEESQHGAALAPSTTSVRADTIQLVQELTEVLESRSVIDQAKGILMTRLAYDAEEASELLTTVSKDANEKVIVIARRMVDSVVRMRQI